MGSAFMKVRFQGGDQDIQMPEDAKTRGGNFKGLAAHPESNEFSTDEAAARYYLSRVFGQDKRPAVRGLVVPENPELVPELRKVKEQSIPLTDTRMVSFEQTHQKIPVFGSRAIVDMDSDRKHLNTSAELVEVGDVSPVAALSPAEALASIAELAGIAVESLREVQPPQLNFYHDENTNDWHLAYFFKEVPAAPPKFMKLALKRKSSGHGPGLSPRQIHPLLDYLVDAHNGTVLFYYSATPLIAIPTLCKGIDENGNVCEFWGSALDSGGFELNDPVCFIKTEDLKFSDMETNPPPSNAIVNNSVDWGTNNPAAISAHVNASRVYEFYNSVLKRNGIDDKRMDLISVVNCTCAGDEKQPQWHNAVWYKNRMWYGQYIENPGGKLRSYSRFLDVIAHELTHGVTSNTSQLVYDGETGALDESFSDIFGVIINNWYAVGEDSDVKGWNWEIGSGQGKNGLPLRDMSDPNRTGDPDHMKKYYRTNQDCGGVHTNSNIHNKAAYNLLTARDSNGKPVFSVREAAVLFYLCLTRLNKLAKFSDALDTLLEISRIYWKGDPDKCQEKINYIREAYEKVGIKGK
jgi:bacillolysin